MSAQAFSNQAYSPYVSSKLCKFISPQLRYSNPDIFTLNLPQLLHFASFASYFHPTAALLWRWLLKCCPGPIIKDFKCILQSSQWNQDWDCVWCQLKVSTTWSLNTIWKSYWVGYYYGKRRNPREGFSPVVYLMAFIAICNLSWWCSPDRWRLLRRRTSSCRKPAQTMTMTNLDSHNFCPLNWPIFFGS